MKDITFGQYYPVDSVVHRLDARTKILMTLLLIVAVFFINSFIAYGALFLFLIIVIASAKIRPLMVLKSIKPVIFLLVFMFILTVLFNHSGKVLLEFWIIKITDGGLITGGMLSLRLISLVLVSSVLTFTTTPVALTDGIESLLKPLTYIKIPVHVFALTMSITLRFIPILSNETSKIIKAQKARGADFESGNIFKRAKALIPIMIPLLISAFRHAQELALAMDARCYNGAKGRTKYKKLKFDVRDLLASFFVINFVILIIINKFLLGF